MDLSLLKYIEHIIKKNKYTNKNTETKYLNGYSMDIGSDIFFRLCYECTKRPKIVCTQLLCIR